MRRLAATVLVLVLVSVAGCEQIVGFDGSTYVGAINTMCACNEVQTAFGSTATCKSYFQAGLARGTTADVDAWLKTFDQDHCATCTPGDISSKIPCIDVAPMCVAIGMPCVEPAECCGYSKDTTQCIHTGVGMNAECRACKSIGTPCNSSEECCGYHKDDAEPPYCSPETHLCVVKAADCKKTGQLCASSTDCCGSEGGLATCTTSNLGQKVCSEKCFPTTPDNCPGCCATVNAAIVNGGECRDNAPAACSSYCDPNNPMCPGGMTCQETCFQLGTECAYFCSQ